MGMVKKLKILSHLYDIILKRLEVHCNKLGHSTKDISNGLA
jgi:hypothetical protein